MKKILLYLLCVTPGFASWGDLAVGMSSEEVVGNLELPLLVNHNRKGLEMWTYDRGGHVCCLNGKVLFWTVPTGSELEAGVSPRSPAAVKSPPSANAPATTSTGRERPAIGGPVHRPLIYVR